MKKLRNCYRIRPLNVLTACSRDKGSNVIGGNGANAFNSMLQNLIMYVSLYFLFRS